MPVSSSILIALAAAAAQVAAPSVTPHTASQSPNARDKMICKKFLETGSLVRGIRVCKTRGDWDRDRDNLRTTATTGTACNTSVGDC